MQALPDATGRTPAPGRAAPGMHGRGRRRRRRDARRRRASGGRRRGRGRGRAGGGAAHRRLRGAGRPRHHLRVLRGSTLPGRTSRCSCSTASARGRSTPCACRATWRRATHRRARRWSRPASSASRRWTTRRSTTPCAGSCGAGSAARWTPGGAWPCTASRSPCRCRRRRRFPRRGVPCGCATGLFVCGDHRDTGSLQGALYSGRRAAAAVRGLDAAAVLHRSDAGTRPARPPGSAVRPCRSARSRT